MSMWKMLSSKHQLEKRAEKQEASMPTDSVQNRIRRLERLSHLMDQVVPLPGGFRIGLDGLMGLIPVIGDLSTAAISGYLINQARLLGVPGHIIARMMFNVVIDTLLGAIPVVGDIFDFFNKANTKNINLLLAYADEQGWR